MLERSFDLSYSEFQTEWSSSLVNDFFTAQIQIFLRHDHGKSLPEDHLEAGRTLVPKSSVISSHFRRHVGI